MDITRASMRSGLAGLGVAEGDVILVRASLKAIGGAAGSDFLGALLDAVGRRGTVASLAFTKSAFAWQASKLPPYTRDTPSYAGALPNLMVGHPESYRSLHPQCSFVAIGNHARQLTEAHGPHTGAYEPMRQLIALRGKMVLVGCVDTNPGFTTAHLAEVDLGLHRRRIAPWLSVSRYVDEQGKIRTFHRRDPGLCSNSFWKFYSSYVKSGNLTAAKVGKAYSICAPAAECYAIEREILSRNSQFTVCDSKDCATCNVLRWDRLHRWPAFLARRMLRKRGS